MSQETDATMDAYCERTNKARDDYYNIPGIRELVFQMVIDGWCANLMKRLQNGKV